MLVLALSRHSREWIHAFANCSCSRLILPIASLSSNDFYYDHDFPRFFSFSFRTIRIRVNLFHGQTINPREYFSQFASIKKCLINEINCELFEVSVSLYDCSFSQIFKRYMKRNKNSRAMKMFLRSQINIVNIMFLYSKIQGNPLALSLSPFDDSRKH